MPSDRLDRYRAKRAAGRTPEPFGGEGDAPGAGGRVASTGHLYVFHKHHARNLHWDLRLELDGALESWAVPKGPSPDPADKRLAMHVEPHPLDYAEFEGVIPEGEYGAGPSIVWDKGVWIPIEDPHEGLEKGKLLFELRGYKVRGLWTLVHTPKAGEKHWLLIKERDAFVQKGAGTDVYPDDSIYSGLEVDELPRAAEHAEELAARARDSGARAASGGKPLGARDVEVMKATAREAAFTDEGWVFELKYDGYRLVAGLARAGGEASLISRNGNDLTATFPEIDRAIRGLPFADLVLDGEVVVHDARGLPSFGRLQRRGRLQNRRDIARATLELPAVYYAFDLLGMEGLDLRALPLIDRKALLQALLPSVGPIRYSEHIAGQGEAMYEHVVGMRLEGIVAKKADSPYRGGRSRSWYKIRAVRSGDFVVVGWTDPARGRAGFGALHVAQWRGDDLLYMGSVGTGFSDAQLAEAREALEGIAAPEAPVVRGDDRAELPRGEKHHWVKPLLVVEVTYKEVTEAGQLRHPSFVRFRDDKTPDECRLEEDVAGVRGGLDARDPLPEPAPPEPDEKTVHFTNLDKVFWPEEGYTKGDLIEYYGAISPWLLPYLEDRPLVLTRFPDGIDGKSFYQKDAPVWAPDWIRTVTVWSESSERELNYFVAEDRETLLYLANMGTIPMHVWHSRIETLARPDWCLLDLDPKDAPFSDVVEVALFIHELCDDIALPHYVKTTGSTGLHVLIPLGRQMTYDQSRALGELLARIVATERRDIATVERVVSKRAGKVYVDFLQNRHGQLMAGPYAVRPKPGATVSAPLSWSEVGADLDLRDHTIKTLPERMASLADGDPMLPVLTERPTLLPALERLMDRVGE
ncbi:MAG TPA: DNA ligase D [Longimicrobiales bacterium]